MADFNTTQAVDGFVTVFGAQTMGVFGQIVLPILIALSAFSALDGDAFVGLYCVGVIVREQPSFSKAHMTLGDSRSMAFLVIHVLY